MKTTKKQSAGAITHFLLAEPLHQGLYARWLTVEGERVVAANVPPIRHFASTGFSLGDATPEAADLALSCVQVILDRLHYLGPTQPTEEGGAVTELALALHGSFLHAFVEEAQGEEMAVPWQKALAWARRALLAHLSAEEITLESVLERWRQQGEALPTMLSADTLDRQELMFELRSDLIELSGQLTILAQFLGMPG